MEDNKPKYYMISIALPILWIFRQYIYPALSRIAYCGF